MRWSDPFVLFVPFVLKRDDAYRPIREPRDR